MGGSVDPASDDELDTKISHFFEALWRDYVSIAPSAARIRSLFTADNPSVENDHVAFRTFDREPVRLEDLERHFLELGYRRSSPYVFEEKKLDAWSYEPPRSHQPRIFLSALRTRELSADARSMVEALCRQIDPNRVEDRSIFYAGVLWQRPTWPEYERLRVESEYAAWLSIMGYRANHFTISVNSLRTPRTLEGVIERVEAAGFPINASGGKLKGSRTELLEQASTLADRIPVRFGDGSEHPVPSCYYEFARRHPTADGTLYSGFVAASADRLFESTDRATSDP
jgi:hypothetical protein